MKKIIMLSIFYSRGLFGGTGMGGGTPPSRDQLKDQLMSAEFASAGLFYNGADIGLLTNRELQPQMNLSSNRLSGSGLKISEIDFQLLSERKNPIDSIGTSGGNVSYRISDGDELDTLILTDRREAARAAVK